MARPPCPVCGDNFSVAGVSSLYRGGSTLRSHSKDGGLASAETLAPPRVARVSGRWLALRPAWVGCSAWSRGSRSCGCGSVCVWASYLRSSNPGNARNARPPIDPRWRIGRRLLLHHTRSRIRAGQDRAMYSGALRCPPPQQRNRRAWGIHGVGCPGARGRASGRGSAASHHYSFFAQTLAPGPALRLTFRKLGHQHDPYVAQQHSLARVDCWHVHRVQPVVPRQRHERDEPRCVCRSP